MAAGPGFRSGFGAARLNPAGAPLDHVAATGISTGLAGCGIKNVVTRRAMSVIINWLDWTFGVHKTAVRGISLARFRATDFGTIASQSVPAQSIRQAPRTHLSVTLARSRSDPRCGPPQRSECVLVTFRARALYRSSS